MFSNSAYIHKNSAARKFDSIQEKGKTTTDPLCNDPSGNVTLTGVP
tara:strand:- start:98 stop:235 length:138 start_codon:yes stop_codon:yes gene_type:complete